MITSESTIYYGRDREASITKCDDLTVKQKQSQQSLRKDHKTGYFINENQRLWTKITTFDCEKPSYNRTTLSDLRKRD